MDFFVRWGPAKYSFEAPRTTQCISMEARSAPQRWPGARTSSKRLMIVGAQRNLYFHGPLRRKQMQVPSRFERNLTPALSTHLAQFLQANTWNPPESSEHRTFHS